MGILTLKPEGHFTPLAERVQTGDDISPEALAALEDLGQRSHEVAYVHLSTLLQNIQDRYGATIHEVWRSRSIQKAKDGLKQQELYQKKRSDLSWVPYVIVACTVAGFGCNAASASGTITADEKTTLEFFGKISPKSSEAYQSYVQGNSVVTDGKIEKARNKASNASTRGNLEREVLTGLDRKLEEARQKETQILQR